MVNVASRCLVLSKSETNLYNVKPQVNFETLERISPLPVRCTTVLLICWGNIKHSTNIEGIDWQWESLRSEPDDNFQIIDWEQIRDKNYGGMKLIVHKYESMED